MNTFKDCRFIDSETVVALALKAAADGFSSPVESYVRDEARRRWEKEHPELDAWLDGPDKDWELESWKILARAALKALNEMYNRRGVQVPLEDI